MAILYHAGCAGSLAGRKHAPEDDERNTEQLGLPSRLPRRFAAATDLHCADGATPGSIHRVHVASATNGLMHLTPGFWEDLCSS